MIKGEAYSRNRLTDPSPSLDWRQKAACRDHPPELWEAGGFSQLDSLAKAEQICYDCPVMIECERSATKADLQYSMRGGRMPTEQPRRPMGRPLGYSPVTGVISVGKGSKTGMLAQGVCPEGLHRLTEQSQVLTNGQCRECYNRRQRDRRARNRLSTPAKPHFNTVKTHCSNGHEFTEKNTYRAPGKPNKRVCRACDRDRKSLG